MSEFHTIYKEHSLILECANKAKNSLKSLLTQHGQKISDYQPVQVGARKGKKFILVIGGGMSAEREVSLMSADNIINALLSLDYYVLFVDMGTDIANVVHILRPDIVYNALHGTYGEDGCLPGLLNILRMPYTGPGVLASSLALNKKKSYELLQANKILIAKMRLVHRRDQLKNDPLPRPYVIKPISQGSSLGVEVIFPEDKFNFADYQFTYGEEIIVEEYIRGRELQVAILNGKAIGTLEIKLPANKRFFDYEAKYQKSITKHIVPAPLSSKAEQELLAIAEQACGIFDCLEGMIRAEFIYEENSGKFYILELNTHPGMTSLSICPEIAANYGLNYQQLISEILKLAKYE